ncbi:MAG: hypothetical protein PSU84_16890 [Methylobacter sp.]|uniref:hypothetical protein n=1 Tax=Methylobacter sp. TaxID=2051955 RepID=UPI00248A84C5|nr:hypothetical protein [Methylobacter sp.]MDI1359891.1 hypothetical protein [Methylobacter sp.]
MLDILEKLRRFLHLAPRAFKPQLMPSMLQGCRVFITRKKWGRSPIFYLTLLFMFITVFISSSNHKGIFIMPFSAISIICDSANQHVVARTASLMLNDIYCSSKNSPRTPSKTDALVSHCPQPI